MKQKRTDSIIRRIRVYISSDSSSEGSNDDEDRYLSEDSTDSIPPVSIVSFMESASTSPAQNSISAESTDLSTGVHDTVDIYETALDKGTSKPHKKEEWKKIFPKNIEKLSHSGYSDNHYTNTTASPSESLECEDDTNSQYDFDHRDLDQIAPLRPPKETSPNNSPRQSYESFKSLLFTKHRQPSGEAGNFSSYQRSSTPRISNKVLFESDAEISMLSHDSNLFRNHGETATSMTKGSSSKFQSFILSLAFMAIWSPQNLMAPNLTQMATFFEFDSSQRDALLGANIAFATGVLSLPISSSIGFLADVVPSRRDLYALTVFVGGLSSLSCGLSDTYTKLYFGRFVNGGCMAGCTPVAFSMLGDLFETEERNMASSALTAMMGVGIIMGQVVAGMIGPGLGWRLPFHLAAILCLITSIMVIIFVEEPVRGGKEEMLREMIKKGKAYDRKLTLEGFLHAMRHNRSNVILMFQGFFSSVPWGIIFVFLNDYLSQEQGLSVQDATFLVAIFGLGCAGGGLFGGAGGQYTSQLKISYLPIFMGVSTLLGILPFLGLLDLTFHTASLVPILLALSGGLIANLPSVNVRPCLINVNPPEMRGAALTAANSIINLARGIGPSFLTWICSIFNVNRTFSFNVLLIFFWTFSAFQLFWLADTLPHDKSKMEHDLAQYANGLFNNGNDHEKLNLSFEIDDESAIVSIEDRMTTFDGSAIRESLTFLSDTLKELTRRPERRGLPDNSDSWESIERVRIRTNAPVLRKIKNEDHKRKEKNAFILNANTKHNLERSRSVSASAAETLI